MSDQEFKHAQIKANRISVVGNMLKENHTDGPLEFSMKSHECINIFWRMKLTEEKGCFKLSAEVQPIKVFNALIWLYDADGNQRDAFDLSEFHLVTWLEIFREGECFGIDDVTIDLDIKTVSISITNSFNENQPVGSTHD